MAEIKKITPETSLGGLSKFKLFVFILLIVGAIVLGLTISSRQQESDVLGEETVDLTQLATSEINQILGKDSDIVKDPQKMIDEGQSLLSSRAAQIGDFANQKVEQVASQAARNVTDFVYKNTIERLIDSLIYSLPEERQKQYK